MDRLSLVGVIFAVVAILGGNYIEGGHVSTLLNGAAAVIVFGGTLGAGLLQTPATDMQRALKISRWVFQPPDIDFNQGIEKVVGWSMHSRRYGLLGLEKQADLEDDEFLKKGLQLIADGSELEVIRGVLEVELNVREQRDLQAAKFYESMGGYAPTVGIIGAVMGLIHVMTNLAEPSALGSGIATAFVATIYGVAAANLILLPIASKLRSIVFASYQYREMMLEGMLSIAQGHNPVSIRVKLEGYLK
ncbi:flagellar motor protein [Motiliproteus sp. MSK22-1]|uniref:flagellar motor protein n=1 Tax=Motiliproteus sp. MSK22-1 TaxID=1897630 RepID=UPI000977463B|nr:flagellar motor protein [Motiliproteus sp. MSK22-1]OMH30055.1 flagellar motor protein [Motiliproteus sp. MSK22-1]